MALFEQSPARSGSRFGKFSSNMFFTRNTAKPKRVRHIEGLNGALICSVNDDPSVVRSTSASSLDFSRTNLPSFETSRRVERLLPPMSFWNTYGVIQDTDHWRHELASLASASGLGIEKEDQKHNNRPKTTADQPNASRSGARYSARTGRFNEGTSKSRGRTGSKHGTAYSDMLFNVPENEREMWMLQVLCQLLGTSNLEDVQSWLVSASQTEREQARTMINSALRGLKESERTTSNQSSEPTVDLNSLSNFVEKQKNEEKQVSQKYIKETLNRPLPPLQSITEEQKIDNNLDDSWAHLANNNSSNSTTYKNAFQNYNRRSYSSFDTTNNKNDEQIDTIQLDEDHQQRPRSALLTKIPKSQSSFKRPVSTHHEKSRVESLQLNDDDNETNIENEDEQQQQQKEEIILPPIKVKELSNQDDNAKARKIRDLQNKLSRQEEKSKKQLNELQSKQSRLENALKLLVKQTSSYGKRRQQNPDEKEDIDSTNDRRHHTNSSSKENNSLQNTNSSDNRPTRSFSGVWKPDASTLHRLQGN